MNLVLEFTENFHGLGKMNDYQVKFYTVKPIAVPPQPIPNHLIARVGDVIESMIKEGVIEEHPPNKPIPWVSCGVIVLISDGSLRINLSGCS